MRNNGYPRNFKLMVAGSNIDNISDYMMLVLFPWIVLSITNSSFLTGLELSLSYLPLSMSFLFGYYLTRLKKKKPLYVGATGMRALILLFIFFVFLTGDKFYELIAIFVGYFLTSWTEDVTGQIGGYWIKEFLYEDQYQKGFSLSAFINAIIILISYILAGSFIAIGTGYAFPVLILGFAISTVIRTLIKPKSDEVNESPRHSFREGFSYIWKNKALRYLLILAMLLSLSTGGFLMVIEVLVKSSYNSSALILTIMLVGGMVGGVLGSKYADRIKGNPRKVSSAILLALVPMILFIPFSPSYIYLIPDLFLLMFSAQILGVVLNTIFYKATPEDYMLQVGGAHSSMALSPAVLSGIILGAIIQLISLEWAFFFMAIIVGLSIFIIWKAREIGEFKL